MTPRDPDSSTRSAHEAMISLRDVHVSLGRAAARVDILRGLDFQAYAGETIGVMGPSGSGKSTFLMVLAGLEKAVRGVVEVSGYNLTSLSESKLADFRREEVGVIFQSFHLIPTMTARENVAMPLEIAGNDGAMRRAEEELDAVGLRARSNHYPAELSGGEQQRVAIARALIAGAGLIVADEPTGNLDEERGAEIVDLLFRRTNDVGATLLLVTHDLALARRCQRLLFMREGALVPQAEKTRT